MSALYDGNPLRLVDQTREPHQTPCIDCGRTHLQGEHVMWRPIDRLVWEGCADCWIKRTNPTKP